MSKNKDPKQILRSRTDLTEDVIERMTDNDAWQKVYGLETTKKNQRIQVCFTGFRATEKIQLEQIAFKSNLQVRPNVTQKLDFLVCGSNCGPSKLEKAKMQNTRILDKEAFIRFTETGEIPG